MDQAEIRKKTEAIIAKYNAFGTVCDVWLSTDVMATLDPRPPMARVFDEPYKIGDVYVTAFSQLKDYEFRVALVNEFEVLSEPSSDN